MADNTLLNLGVGGDTIAMEDIGGIKHELVKLEFGVDGVATKVSATDPLPVTDADATTALNSIAAEDFATQTTLAAILAKITSDPATQTTLAAILAKLIAAPSTEAKQDAANAFLTTIAAITQPLTDTQLRAAAVPVSGTVTVNEPVSIDDNGGALTVDAVNLDIRDLVFATDKADVSGSANVGVTGTFFQATQPVSAAALPLPTGASTEVTIASIDTKMTSMLALLAGMTFIEVAATFAGIAVSTAKRLIYVTADENNADATALYIHNGTELKFLLIIP